ncbi:MAG: hypothetical protein ACRDPD_02775 [Streptosporangiaceae bacterium]
MTTLRLAILAALCLAILHMLAIRVGIMPGVHVPIAAMVLGAELAAVPAMVALIVRKLRSTPVWSPAYSSR